MNRPPLILVSPCVECKGEEFGDQSTSLSETYQRALLAAGTIPLSMPATISKTAISACVNRCCGVLLTGGEDVDPKIYGRNLPKRLREKVIVTPDGGQRDLREIMLVDEVFRQRKPLLAICRGHQILNVALGGTLIADIPSEVPGAINHQRRDKRSQVVHEAKLTPGSFLSKIVGGLSLGVNSTHHQAVGRVAKPLRVAAISGDGIVEGLELKPAVARRLPFLLSVQFHPERLVDRYAEHRAIFAAFAQACARNGK